ncbi:MAG: BamA/TamA family outer membrane protein [Planctomycetota bacterium]|nr:BamA/TamA family outer membrane protein [Planctomycetota bacterium]
MSILRRIKLLLLVAVALLGACATTDPDLAERLLPGTKLIFEGAERYTAEQLEKLIHEEIRRYAKRPRQTVLDDAAFRIESQYRFRGYAQIQVSVESTPEEIHFRISEGPLIRLGRVHFRGNSSIGKKELKRLVPKGFLGADPPFSPRLVSHLQAKIRVLYSSRGYIDIKIKKPVLRYDREDQAMTVTFLITEGPQYHLVSIKGLPSAPKEIARLNRFIGKPYARGTLEAIDAFLVDHYRDHGHPYITVTSKRTLHKENATVSLSFEIDKGVAAKMGDLKLQEKLRTSRSYIRRRIDIELGDEFRTSKLLAGEQRLRETGLFRSVEIYPDSQADENGIVPLNVRLEENDPGEIAFRAGYGTVERLHMGLDFGYQNLFGGGEVAQLSGDIGQKTSRGTTEFAMPFFLGTNLRPAISGFLEEREYPSFEATRYGGIFSMGYPLLDRVTATAGIEYAVIQPHDIDLATTPDVPGTKFTSLSVSASWEGRDSVATPSEGFFLRGKMEWAPKQLGSETRFMNLRGHGGHFLQLPWGIVLATSLQAGLIRPIQDAEEVDIALRYFAGGTNSIRGFDYDSVGAPEGGELFLSLQTELRFPIWAGFHGALFHDRGGIWEKYKDLNWSDSRWSIGGGLRYYTPAGPIAADVAWNADRKEGEDSVTFHFSIGFPF